MCFNSFALVTAGLVLTASFAFAQATETLTGTVSDAMCGNKHMLKGESAAQCTRDCVKEGSDYALVVGDRVYTLKGDKAAIDKLAGANVVVKGTLTGSTVTMESIKAAQ
jgi:hypothetical protein